MVKCRLEKIVRDALFMVFVLTKEDVSKHFDLSELSECYKLLFNSDLENDYLRYRCFCDDNEEVQN